jgi:hypothetical protein
MTDQSGGFGPLVHDAAFGPEVASLMPATRDRFCEARFFAQLAQEVSAGPDQSEIVNWFVSAHLAATIGIWDAARSDFERLDRMRDFKSSAVAREFFLRSDDSDPLFRDPLAMNRAYRDLRNLRVHHAKTIVILDTRVLLDDVTAGRGTPLSSGEPRWYLWQISAEDLRLLRRCHLREAELPRFNEWVSSRPLATVLMQHLWVLHGVISDTATYLSSPS